MISPLLPGLADGSNNDPFTDPKMTADYVATWVQGANASYGLHIDYGGYSGSRCALVPLPVFIITGCAPVQLASGMNAGTPRTT